MSERPTQAALLQLLRGQATVADTTRATGLSARELVAWRKAHLRGKVPPRSGQISAPVRRPTAIRWDVHGVPHLYADDVRDLWVALGYAMAQERLWQLDYMRRFARGELAEVLGRESLANDRLLRTLDLKGAAEASLPALEEDEAEALEGISHGINAWTEQCQHLPVEFELLDYGPQPWRPVDSILLWKYRWWTLTGRLEQIAVATAAERYLPPALRSAYLSTELADETIVPGTAAGRPSGYGHDTGIGSNNWALAGHRTTTGAPALCSDPHNMFGNPPQWLEAHLVAPGLDAAGAIYLATPGIYLGRSRDCAWGVTNHAVSVRDLVAEETKPDNPNLYRVGDAWQPFALDHQQINVAGEPAVDFVVRRSRHGPIVSEFVPVIDDPGWPPLALRWIGHEPPTGFPAMLALQTATTTRELLAALRQWPCPPLNFVYATTEGEIGYHVVGQVPAPTGGGRAVQTPGTTWTEVLTFDDLPKLHDPPRGWVATANGLPWAWDAESASYLERGAWSDGYRQRRIRGRIEAADRHLPTAVADIHGDVVHERARLIAAALGDALTATAEPDLVRCGLVLQAWDGAYTVHSGAPTIFQAIWEAWRDRVAAARLPASVLAVGEARGQASAIAYAVLDDQHADWWPTPNTDVEAEFAAAARHALSELVARHGCPWPTADAAVADLNPAWHWGRVHRVTFPHPLGHRQGLRRLNVGPFATSGGRGTVRAAGHDLGFDFTVTSGSTYRLLADLSQNLAWTTVTTGQSGHPASPHYRDQVQYWLQNDYHPLWLEAADVLANQVGHTTLLPRP